MARDALIAGGGIAGLGAALALAARNFDVTILEQHSIDTELGAGLQLSPNAMHVLTRLGLEDAIAKAASYSRVVDIRAHKSGVLAAQFPLGAVAEQRFGARYGQIHRRALVGILADAALKHPNITVVEKTEVRGIEEASDACVVHTAGGGRWQAGAVIAADGVHSGIARAMGIPAPEFIGQIAWRALVPADVLPKKFQDDLTVIWTGPGAHVVHYPLPDGWVNLIACVERDNNDNADWAASNTNAELLGDFRGWHNDVQTLLKSAKLPRSWALYDRPAPHVYFRGRAVLIGDACHPMLPFAAQGAAQALEDGWALAACMAANDNAEHAFAHYQKIREPRISQVVAESRSRAQLYHQRSVVSKLSTLGKRLAGNSVQGWTDPEYDWLYGYDITRELP